MERKGAKMEQESEKLLLNGVSGIVDDNLKPDGCGSDSVDAKCLSDSETCNQVHVEEEKKSDLYSDDETCTDGKEKCTHFDDEYEGGDETISNETEQSDDDDSTDEELYKLVKVVSKKRKHSKMPPKRRPESSQHKEHAMDSHRLKEDPPMGLESGPDKALNSQGSETEQPETPPKNSSTCDNNPAASQPLNRQFSLLLLLLVLVSMALMFQLFAAVSFLSITRLYQMHGDLSSCTTISSKGYRFVVWPPELMPTPSAPPSILSPSPTKTLFSEESDFDSFQKSTNHPSYQQCTNSLTSSTALILHPEFSVCQNKIDSPTPLVRNIELTDLFIPRCKASSLAKHDSSTTALMVHPDFGVCQRFRSKHHSPMMLVLRLGLAGNIVSLMERISLTKCDNSIALSYKQCTNSLTSSTALILHLECSVCQNKINSPTPLVCNNELTELFISSCKVSSLAKHDRSTTALMVHPDFGVCQRFRSKHHSPMMLVLRLGLAGNIASLMERISLTKYINSIALFPHPDFGEFVSSQLKQFEFKLQYSRFHPNFGVVPPPINAIMLQSSDVLLSNQTFSDVPVWQRTGVEFEVVHPLPFLLPSSIEVAVLLALYFMTCLIKRLVRKFSVSDSKKHFNKVGCFNDALPTSIADSKQDPSARDATSNTTHRTASADSIDPATSIGETTGDSLSMQDPSSTTDSKQVHSVRDPDNTQPASVEQQEHLADVTLASEQLLNGSSSSSDSSIQTSAEIEKALCESNEVFCPGNISSSVDTDDSITCLPRPNEPSTSQPLECEEKPPPNIESETPDEVTVSPSSLIPEIDNASVAEDPPPLPDGDGCGCDSEHNTVLLKSNAKDNQTDEGYSSLTGNTEVSPPTLRSDSTLTATLDTPSLPNPPLLREEKTPLASLACERHAPGKTDIHYHIMSMKEGNLIEETGTQPVGREGTASEDSTEPAATNGGTTGDSLPMQDPSSTTDSKQVHSVRDPDNPQPASVEQQEQLTDAEKFLIRYSTSETQPLKCEKKPPPNVDNGSLFLFIPQANDGKAEVADHPPPLKDVIVLGCDSDHNAVPLRNNPIEIEPQRVKDKQLQYDTNFKHIPDEPEDNAKYSSKKEGMFMAPTPDEYTDCLSSLVHGCKEYRSRPTSLQKVQPKRENEAEPPEDPPDPAPNIIPAGVQQQANPDHPGQDNNPIPVSQDPEDPSPVQEPLIAAAQVVSHHDGNDTPKLFLTMGGPGSEHPGPALPDVNEFGSGREQNSVTLQSDAHGIEPHSVMDNSLPDSTGHVPPEDNALSKKKDKSDLVEDDYCSSSIVHGLIITRYQPIQPSSLGGGKPKRENVAEPPEDPPDPAPNLDPADTQQQAVIGPEQYDNLIPNPQDPLDLAPIQECLNAATQIVSHRDENDIPQPRVCLMGGPACDRPTALSDVKGIGSGRERDAMVLQSDVEAIEPQHILNKSLCDSNDHLKHVPPDKPEDSAKLVSNKDKVAVPIMVENDDCSSSMDVHGFNTYHTLRGGKPKRENVAEPPKDPPDPAPNLDPANTQQQPLIAAAQVVSHHDGNDTPKLFLTMGGPGSDHPGPVLPDVNEFGSGREHNSMTLQSDAQGIEPHSVMDNSLSDSTGHVPPEDNTDSLLKKKDKFAITPVLVEYDNCSSSIVHGLIITRYQPIQPSSLEGGKPKREKEAEPPEDPPDPAPNLVPADAQQQAVLGPGQYDNLIPIPQDPPDLAPIQECLNAATQIVSHRDENDIPQPSVYLMGGPASDRLTALSDFNGIGSGRERDAMVLQSDVEAIEPQRILDKSPNDHFKHAPPDRPEDSAKHVSNKDKLAVPITVENDDCSTYHTLRGGKPKRENVAEPPKDPPDPAPNLDPANAQQQAVLGPGQYGNLPPPDPPVSAPILYVALKIIPRNVTPKLFVAMAGPGSEDLPLPVVSPDPQAPPFCCSLLCAECCPVQNYR